MLVQRSELSAGHNTGIYWCQQLPWMVYLLINSWSYSQASLWKSRPNNVQNQGHTLYNCGGGLRTAQEGCEVGHYVELSSSFCYNSLFQFFSGSWFQLSFQPNRTCICGHSPDTPKKPFIFDSIPQLMWVWCRNQTMFFYVFNNRHEPCEIDRHNVQPIVCCWDDLVVSFG